MNDDEILIKCAYVHASSYRFKTMIAIGVSTKTPKEISEDAEIRTNHISKVLSELKNEELIVCINEEARKGRLYKLTDDGVVVLNKLLSSVNK